MAIDPICKMNVDPNSAKWKSEYKGKMYYFCAPGCKKAFDANPEMYISEGNPGHGDQGGHGCCH